MSSTTYRPYNRSSSSGSSSENLPPRTLSRVAREIRDLHKNPPEGVRLVMEEASGMPSSLGEIVVRELYWFYHEYEIVDNWWSPSTNGKIGKTNARPFFCLAVSKALSLCVSYILTSYHHRRKSKDPRTPPTKESFSSWSLLSLATFPLRHPAVSSWPKFITPTSTCLRELFALTL